MDTPTKENRPSASRAVSEEAEAKRLAGRLTRDRQSKRSVRHLRRWIILAVLVLVVLGGYLTWRALRPVPVDVSVAAYQRVGAAANPILRLSGFVTYPRTVTVAATARSPVVSLGFEEGERVRQGAVLARFSNAEIEAQRRTQQVALADAQATLDRTQRLYEAGAAAEMDLQRARTALATIRANLDLLDTQQASTVVRAPFSGLVIQKLVEVGEIPTQGICRIVDDSMTLVRVDVNQEDFAQIAPGQPAVVVLDAYPDTEYAARIQRIMPAADQARNTVPVNVEVLVPDAYFVPQLSAKVFFVEEQQTGNEPVTAVLAIAKSVIWQENGQSYVWLIQGGRTVRRQVETGQDLGEQIEIISGLEADDQVVAHPEAHDFEGGERVTAGKIS